MKKIFLLTDYKGFFGLKWHATPYRSGYDQRLLVDYFSRYGYRAEFMRIADVDFARQDWQGRAVVYTSSEDMGNSYKQYIEDIVLGLELCGAHVIPGYPFLRAHNNKVFMEILRDKLLGSELSGLSSQHFGTLEELNRALDNQQVEFPCVLKSAAGAMSKGVSLARDRNELLEKARRISRTPHYIYEFKDAVRTRKMKGYTSESRFQKEFIVQAFIPDLVNDWKVLVYGDQYYVLKRHVRPGDFRASGSHVDYKAGSESGLPIHMLEYLREVYEKLDTPHISLDFGYDGKRGYIFEFQAVYFGTSTQYICKDYFVKEDDRWVSSEKAFDQEEAYVLGIARFLDKKSFPIS